MSDDATDLEPADLEPIDLSAPQGTTEWAPAPPPTPMSGPPGPPGPTGPDWSEPPPRKPRNPRMPAIVAGLVGLALLSGAVGYAIQSSTENDNADATGQTPTTAPGPTTPTAGAAERAALAGLVVRQRDVAPTQMVVLIPDGNRTTQPTLDLCNGTYPSEKRRVARLQVAEVDPDGNSSLSTEAVTYRNAAATAAAFAELRRVHAECPAGPVASPFDGDKLITKFKAAPDGDWPHTPSVDRQAYSFDTQPVDADGAVGEKSPSIAVYLRHGRVLLGLYFPRPDGAQPPIEGKTTVKEIVALFEERMAQLPPAVVGNVGHD